MRKKQHVQLLNKKILVETAGRVGIFLLKTSPILHTKMGHVFRHPKYYEELRRRGREEKEVSSTKQQAASNERQAPKDSSFKRQASSDEQQASSDKPRAASSKISLPS